MRIGFDLDKVLIHYPPFIPSSLIDKRYKLKSNGELLYRIPSKPEQLIRRFSHQPLFRRPIKHNVAFLKEIARERHTLYLISSRFGFLEAITLRLTQKLGFDKIFTRMFFNFQNEQPHTFKNEVLKKLHLDIYVDDDLPLLKYVAKANPKTKFFWLNGSHEKNALSKNIFAITHLSDILKQK